MKEFDPHQITISQEEHTQLVECRTIVRQLWHTYGPYKFPRELRERDSLYDNLSVNSRVDVVMNFDDSE